MDWFRSITLGVGLVSSLSFAADTPAVRVKGSIDIRPTWVTQTGAMRTENELEAGAQLTPDVSITYVQDVLTNLYSPKDETSTGLKADLSVGFIRTRVNNLLKWDNDQFSLGYQSRVYFPTDRAAQNRQQILAARNYFTVSRKVSDSLKLTVSEIPIFFINNRAGVGDAANPIFENRVYLIADVQITEKLSLSFPLMFHQTRRANYSATAANNNDWSFWVWTNPELDYALTPNYTVGLSYYNDAESLMTTDMKKFQIGKGLESGVLQLVFYASL